jgi:hypothetical protein
MNKTLRYLRSRWLYAIIAGYFASVILLGVFFGIDIGIPCLWKTYLGFRCPGCGLTRATGHLLHMDPVAAFRANPLVYLVLPAGIFYMVRDYRRFP